jgi:ribosomal-protein-alanine N-acetyltransferase
MALFGLGADAAPPVEGDGLYLRAPETRDYESWAALRAESRAFLTPWEPTWPEDDLTRSAFRRRLRRYAEDLARDEAHPFFIFEARSHRLLGGLTLSNVRRGVAQTATLGYWMGAPHAGRGHMTRAVAAVCRHAFTQLRLHRIEAACLPSNAPSRALLLRNGFQPEGLARAYLKIDGRWSDHLLFARLDED